MESTPEYLQKFLVSPKGMKRFRVIDKNTGMFLAKLPLTISIKETLEAYERAGYEVEWSWSE
jgi:hypothetical protein